MVDLGRHMPRGSGHAAPSPLHLLRPLQSLTGSLPKGKLPVLLSHHHVHPASSSTISAMSAFTPAMKSFINAERFAVIGRVLTDRTRWDNKVSQPVSGFMMVCLTREFRFFVGQ